MKSFSAVALASALFCNAVNGHCTSAVFLYLKISSYPHPNLRFCPLSSRIANILFMQAEAQH